MQLFAQAIDENQFAQAAQNENENEKETKIKTKKTKNRNNNKLAAWQIVFKARLSLLFQWQTDIFQFQCQSGWREIQKKKRTTRQQASEMLNQIKVPATQMQNKTKKKQKQKRKQ